MTPKSNVGYVPNITGIFDTEKSTLSLSANIPDINGYEFTNSISAVSGVSFKITLKDNCSGTINWLETADYGQVYPFDSKSNEFSEDVFEDEENNLEGTTFLIDLFSEESFDIHLSNVTDSGVVAEIEPMPAGFAFYPEEASYAYVFDSHPLKGGIKDYWTKATVSGDGSVILASSANEDTQTPILSSSITDTTKGAAIISGTVTDGTATLNVACDKACVVAYTTDEGKNYTRVNAAKADSGYNFVVPDYSENMKFVVAVKGDLDGNGTITIAEAAQVKAAQLGKLSLNSVQKLAADLDGNGSITIAEAAQIKAAQLGKLSLSW